MQWTENFRALSGLDDDVRNRLLAGTRVMNVDPGEKVFDAERAVGNLLFIIRGDMRVLQSVGCGHRIVLFRVHAGEACVMPSTYQVPHGSNTAEGVIEGIAETPVQVAAVPPVLCDQLMGESAPFRRFVIDTYSLRLVQLGSVVRDVAFRRVDSRLSQRLLSLADETSTVRATHHDLAAELGTAREVISRQLQEFRRRGWIEAARGEVRIIARCELEKLARSA